MNRPNVPADSSTPPAGRPWLHGLEALVVDDNFSARMTMASMLRGFGLEVTLADSGSSALEAARRASEAGRAFALVVTDWRMPDADGFSVLDSVRLTAAGAQAVRLLMTAHERDDVEAAMPDHTLDAVLQKPVAPAMLQGTLQGVFSRYPVRYLPEDDGTEGADAAGTAATGRGAGPGCPLLDTRHLPRLRGDVLLVEDDEIQQLVAMELLDAIGLRVRVADDAAEALAMLRARAFDAVLMDLRLAAGGPDGWAAARELRGIPGCEGVPVIGISSTADGDARARCLAAGMSDLVAKPVEPALLAAALARVLPLRFGA